MISCKELAVLSSSGEWASAPWPRRLAGWLHLAMCRHCRSFRRQLAALGLAARRASHDVEQECPSSLERDVLDRLREDRR